METMQLVQMGLTGLLTFLVGYVIRLQAQVRDDQERRMRELSDQVERLRNAHGQALGELRQSSAVLQARLEDAGVFEKRRGGEPVAIDTRTSNPRM